VQRGGVPGPAYAVSDMWAWEGDLSHASPAPEVGGRPAARASHQFARALAKAPSGRSRSVFAQSSRAFSEPLLFTLSFAGGPSLAMTWRPRHSGRPPRS